MTASRARARGAAPSSIGPRDMEAAIRATWSRPIVLPEPTPRERARLIAIATGITVGAAWRRMRLWPEARWYERKGVGRSRHSKHHCGYCGEAGHKRDGCRERGKAR